MKVYLEYNQEELNSQYDQRSLVPDPSNFFKIWSETTQWAKTRFNCQENIAYGDHPDELLDLYLPDGVEGKDALAPLLIFCHGGAWQRLSKDDSGYIATVYVPEGIALAALNFSLAPEAKLNLIECPNTFLKIDNLFLLNFYSSYYLNFLLAQLLQSLV